MVLEREPVTLPMTLLEGNGDEGKVERLDPTRVQVELGKLVWAQEQVPEGVLGRVTASNTRMRALAN